MLHKKIVYRKLDVSFPPKWPIHILSKETLFFRKIPFASNLKVVVVIVLTLINFTFFFNILVFFNGKIYPYLVKNTFIQESGTLWNEKHKLSAKSWGSGGRVSRSFVSFLHAPKVNGHIFCSGTVVPLVTWYTVKKLILDPYEARRKEKVGLFVEPISCILSKK